MTTVAWDGVRLAADKRTSFGGLHGTTTKVYRLKDGSIVAGCGTTALIQEMLWWLDSGADMKDFPQSCRDADSSPSMLLITPHAEVRQYENTPFPLKLENGKWAIGSGRDFAMMAMHLGKNAIEAILETSHFDAGTGNGVDWMELKR